MGAEAKYVVSPRRQALALFASVVALTALELATITLGATRAARTTALAGLAIAKGGLILWWFMHLGRQRRSLRVAVLTPIVFGAATAVILMLDAVTRLGGGP